MIRDIHINFDGKKSLNMDFLHDDTLYQNCNTDTRPSLPLCPISNAPSQKSWCGLLFAVRHIMEYFNDIESTRIGELCVTHQDGRAFYRMDAQNMLVYTILSCFKAFPCNSLPSLTRFSQYYETSKEPKEILYQIVSSGMMHHLVSGKEMPTDMLSFIREEIMNTKKSLRIFIAHIDTEALQDSVKNSVVILYNIMELISFDLDEANGSLSQLFSDSTTH